MRTASTRLLDEEFDTLRGYCQDNKTNINELLGALIQKVLEGKIKPRPTRLDSRLPWCPKCGFLMFYYFARSEMACPKCGYFFEIHEPRWEEGEAPKI